jgi:hypothetical protein
MPRLEKIVNPILAVRNMDMMAEFCSLLFCNRGHTAPVFDPKLHALALACRFSSVKERDILLAQPIKFQPELDFLQASVHPKAHRYISRAFQV